MPREKDENLRTKLLERFLEKLVPLSTKKQIDVLMKALRQKEEKMPNKGFTRCKFCNKVIVCDLSSLWIHAATRAVRARYYGCNFYLPKDKKLDLVMRSCGEMGVAQAEPKTTTTTENAS